MAHRSATGSAATRANTERLTGILAQHDLLKHANLGLSCPPLWTSKGNTEALGRLERGKLGVTISAHEAY